MEELDADDAECLGLERHRLLERESGRRSEFRDLAVAHAKRSRLDIGRADAGPSEIRWVPLTAEELGSQRL
jgi:hypothetical protein